MQVGSRMNLGAIIRDGRHARRWTQTALGKRARVSRSMIGAVEGGSANPSLDTLERIAGALDAELVLDLRLPTVIGRADQVDAAHARCVAAARRVLERRGFICAVSARSSTAGCTDGSTSGLRSGAGRLLVVEVKTELRDLGGLQRQLGWYRAAARIPEAAGEVSRSVAVALFLATDANDASLLANRDAITASFPIRGRAARDLLAGSAGAPETGRVGAARSYPSSVQGSGWVLAMIDPRRRGDSIWVATRLDGRRSPAPYRSYADFMAAVARR
jgi:transcriptional regulator with XRE-family HTH domain